MIIDIKRLAREGESFVGEEPPTIWELEDSPDFRAERPLHYELKAFVVTGELVVRGTLGTQVDFRCSRCGEFFAMAVQEPKFEYVLEIGPSTELADLTAEIRETIILNFPAYPVCRPECRGLCARCGARLNDGACGCRTPADDRWGALGGLKIGK
jgi:uncharacterized protein